MASATGQASRLQFDPARLARFPAAPGRRQPRQISSSILHRWHRSPQLTFAAIFSRRQAQARRDVFPRISPESPRLYEMAHTMRNHAVGLESGHRLHKMNEILSRSCNKLRPAVTLLFFLDDVQYYRSNPA